MKYIVTLLAIIALSGCASIIKGNNDNITVNSPAKGTAIFELQRTTTQPTSCDGGKKITYIQCPSCTPPQRQTRVQAQCTETLDMDGYDCSAKSCQTCTCE